MTKTNKIKISALILLIVFQIIILSITVFNGVNTSDTQVKVRVSLYDPYHPLKGRFVRLNFPYHHIVLSQLDNYVDGTYVPSDTVYIEIDKNDPEKVVNIHKKYTNTNENPLIKAEIDSKGADYINLYLNFSNYYIQENFAQEAETLLRDESRIIEAHLDINSRGIVKVLRVTVEGKDIEVFLRDYLKNIDSNFTDPDSEIIDEEFEDSIEAGSN